MARVVVGWLRQLASRAVWPRGRASAGLPRGWPSAGLDELIGNVSHELRTPLTSIQAYSELLLDYDDPAVRREFLEIINTEAQRLARLVGAALDLAKIESGTATWQFASVDIAQLLDQAQRRYAPIMAGMGVRFEACVPPNLGTVQGDRDRLAQVLDNLLNNALKFTPQGTIRLEALQVGGDLFVSVSDTGRGIAQQDQERIFERYQQVVTADEKPRGTGLGLAISREIISRHRGRIWVTSSEGEGSTFTFVLAASPQPRPFPLPAEASKPVAMAQPIG